MDASRRSSDPDRPPPPGSPRPRETAGPSKHSDSSDDAASIEDRALEDDSGDSEGDWWVDDGTGEGDDAASGDLEQPGDRVGPYTLRSRLGEGGFGTVWLADRRVPFTQEVALKLVKPGMDSKAVLARFEQERQALAVMSHPGIATVLDGGLTAKGRPYFAMEFVKGEPITRFCDRRGLGLRARLELFVQACEAVQHAHLKGIVHRDLKPSNILAFEREDAGPRLKVIDFGVAKAMSEPLTEHSIVTGIGQMIGTPQYMSPEQADPTSADIDTRSDIYSLGVLLYELIAGATPFDGRDLRGRSYVEIQRILREVDPPRPSDRLSTISTRHAALSSRIEKARGMRVAELARTLRRELEWIPLMALRKEPHRRYQSAIDFATDVRNYLGGRPLVAAPESTAYLIRKQMRRHRAFVIGAAAVGAALVVGLGMATWQWRVAVVNAAEAIAARNRAEELLTVIAIGGALDAARSADPSAVRRELTVVDTLGRGDRFDARLARALADQSIATVDGHEGAVLGLALSPDGRLLASSGSDGTIRLWDPVSWEAIGEPLRGHAGEIWSIAFSPDGRRLASASVDGTVRVWDAATGWPIGEPLRGHEDEAWSVAFSPDGAMIASGGRDNTIRRWEAGTGRPIGEPLRTDAMVRGVTIAAEGVAFSPDGVLLAGSNHNGTIRVWDARSGQPVGALLRGHEDQVASVVFSPDGTVIASGSDDGTIRLWDATTGQPIGEPLRGHKEGVHSIAFSPDGRTLASGGADRTIRLWDPVTGQAIAAPLRGHEAAVNSVAFGPDGAMLVTGSGDRTIRRWEVVNGASIGAPLEGPGGPINGLAFSPDGSVLAGGCWNRAVQRWDALTGSPIGVALHGHEHSVASVAFSPDGAVLASGGGDGTIRMWDAAAGEAIGAPLRGHGGPVASIAFRPDGTALASAGEDGTIRIWSVASGRMLGEPLRGHAGIVASVAFSPDGPVLASGGHDSTVRLWDAATGRPIGDPLHGHGGGVLAVAFSPDGTILASAGYDQTVRLWDVASRQPIGAPLRGHESGVLAVAFTPDGIVLASASYDQTVRLWDAATGRPIGEPLRGHSDTVTSVAFSPVGTAFASASLDQTIRLWEAVPLRDRIPSIRSRIAQVDEVRSLLADRIAAVEPSFAAVSAFASEVRVDPRFTGTLRTAAQLVVGEVEQALQRRWQQVVAAYRAQEWPRLLGLLSALSIEDCERPQYDLWSSEGRDQFWNRVASRGLTELPADDPERDLERLRVYAERAVELSSRRDGAMLGTLARAHWELGAAATAIELQREAIAAARAQLAAIELKDSPRPIDLEFAARERRSLIATLEALEAGLGRYEEEAGTGAGRWVDTIDTMDTTDTMD